MLIINKKLLPFPFLDSSLYVMIWLFFFIFLRTDIRAISAYLDVFDRGDETDPDVAYINPDPNPWLQDTIPETLDIISGICSIFRLANFSPKLAFY